MCFAGSLCLFLSVLLILYVLWCVFHSYEYLLFDFVLSCSSLLSRPPSAWSVLFSPEHLHCPPFLRLSAPLILARFCPLVLTCTLVRSLFCGYVLCAASLSIRMCFAGKLCLFLS